jgi:hypothetical protein
MIRHVLTHPPILSFPSFSWAIFLPASYPAFGGWLSIMTYAVSTGLPLLLIAEFGYKVCTHILIDAAVFIFGLL